MVALMVGLFSSLDLRNNRFSVKDLRGPDSAVLCFANPIPIPNPNPHRSRSALTLLYYAR